MNRITVFTPTYNRCHTLGRLAESLFAQTCHAFDWYVIDDGSIDETYTVKQDDLVEFPVGYHTTVGAPGYNTYFLWLMAGEHQGFFRSNDPDHDWVTAVENMVKKSK